MLALVGGFCEAPDVVKRAVRWVLERELQALRWSTLYGVGCVAHVALVDPDLCLGCGEDLEADDRVKGEL